MSEIESSESRLTGTFDPAYMYTPRGVDPRNNGAMPVRELARRMGRRWKMLLAIPTVIVALVAAWVFTATPRYRSLARLRVESKSQQSPLGETMSALPGASLLGLGRDELETEIGVLRSDRLTDATIDALALGVRVVSPAGNRGAVLSARTIEPLIDVDGELRLERQPDGRFRVERRQLENVTVPPSIAAGDSLRVGGFMIGFAPQLRTGPAKVVVQFIPRYRLHQLMNRRLIVGKQEGGSRLVEVSYEDPDAVLAAQVVGRLVGEYVAYSNTVEREEDTTAVTQLRRQVDSTARRLAQAETELRAFEERYKLIAPEEQATAQVKRVAAISGAVDALSVERNALARMLALIGQKSQGDLGPSAYRQLATFPSLITNRAIQDLLQSLIDLENKRSALSVRRTTANEEYKQFTDRIAELERQLFGLGSQYLESLDQQLATTAQAVTALTDTMSAMPGAAMQYGRLVRDRTLSEAIYLTLQKQLKVAELKDALRQERVRVVDVPRVANPRDRVFPKKLMMLVVAGVLGVALALTLALLAEIWRGDHEPVSA
jgi:uncharacterized protein involved in exopolysaccharide biosynthesis